MWNNVVYKVKQGPPKLSTRDKEETIFSQSSVATTGSCVFLPGNLSNSHV